MQHSSASHFPKAKKTGTTIVGIIFKDGVVLGADTRATEVVICIFYMICVVISLNVSISTYFFTQIVYEYFYNDT